MKLRARCGGFSLLEMLVAFTILALVLGALFQIFSAGMHAARSGDRYSRATEIAQSKLAALGVEYALTEGTVSGTTDDDYHWRITVSPYIDDQLPIAEIALRPLRVNVEILWDDGGKSYTFALKSMMLEPERT